MCKYCAEYFNRILQNAYVIISVYRNISYIVMCVI